MKQIVRDKYLKIFKFSSSQEATTFLRSQDTKNVLSIDDTLGDTHFCYVCFHSLTHKKQFILYFSSDEDDNSLNFLFWEKHKMLVLDTGNGIYLINDSLNITASFEITTPLIGLYLIDDDRLLILEEAFLRLINSEGKILKSELFDLIVELKIENGQLFMQTNEGNKVFDLV